MKNILLLTDFSKSATNAVHFAMRFFESDACTFHIIHVHKAGTFIADDLMVSPTESIYESFTRVPKRKLEALVSSLKERFHNPKHTFETVVDFDVFTDAVNQVVNRKSIDYVVIGSNGVTGAKEVLFGSNTINVIRHVVCKTLVIPNGYTFKPVSNFLLPLQFDDHIKDEQLKVIKEFIERSKFKLHVLRTTNKESCTAITSNDQEQLGPLDCKYTLEQQVSFYQAVTNYLKSHPIDMTGLIVHDKSFIKRFFTESPTIELSKVIKLPLLLFHDEKN